MEKIPAFRNEIETLKNQTELFHERLIRFRYEGKVQRVNNLVALQDIIEKLLTAFNRHRRMQEKIIYPFFKMRVPLNKSAVYLLEAEHEDIKKTAQRLKASIKNALAKEDASGTEAYEAGVYLIALLRHHVEFERRIYAWMLREISHADRRILIECVGKWLGKVQTEQSQRSEPKQESIVV